MLLERLMIPPPGFQDVCLKTFCAVKGYATTAGFQCWRPHTQAICCAQRFSLWERAFVPPFSSWLVPPGCALCLRRNFRKSNFRLMDRCSSGEKSQRKERERDRETERERESVEGRSEKRKSQRQKEYQSGRQVEKSRNAVFSQCFVVPEGRKSMKK